MYRGIGAGGWYIMYHDISTYQYRSTPVPSSAQNNKFFHLKHTVSRSLLYNQSSTLHTACLS
jgi:hypothetical protein